MEVFDFDAHEKQVAAKYQQLARIEAFDKFIDLALDGVVSFDSAVQGYLEEAELIENGTN